MRIIIIIVCLIRLKLWISIPRDFFVKCPLINNTQDKQASKLYEEMRIHVQVTRSIRIHAMFRPWFPSYNQIDYNDWTLTYYDAQWFHLELISFWFYIYLRFSAYIYVIIIIDYNYTYIYMHNIYHLLYLCIHKHADSTLLPHVKLSVNIRINNLVIFN